jgi:MoxR-like ATPase
MTQTADRLRKIVTEMSDQFYERSAVIRALAVAVLAGQHSLLLGPPGTAKSQLARGLTGCIDGARYWEILLSKFTDPKRMFGPVDVAALTRGEYTQVFDRRATTCEIAFIDEIFKCSAGALNETLSYLNERVYFPENGGPPIECPLIAAVTASNELPSGEDLAAVYDRLLVRLEVGYLADPASFAALVKSAVTPAVAPVRTTVDLADLRVAVETEVPAIEVPDGIVDAVCTLRAALRRQELIASDRRWKQSVRLLQASAWLAGRDAVDDSDPEILGAVLWDSVAQKGAVEREVLQLVNPDAREALDLADAVREIETELDAKHGQSREHLSEWAIKEANGKLTRAASRLTEMRKTSETAGRATGALDAALSRTRAVHGRVLVEALGVPAAVVEAQLGGQS